MFSSIKTTLVCHNNNHNNNNKHANNNNNNNKHTANQRPIDSNMLDKMSMDMKKSRKEVNCNGMRKAKTVEIRKEEVMAIRNRFPTKIPIIVQRFTKENNLPSLDKSKFLVPQEITMSQFQTIIRNRMRINSSQALYLLINNRSMVSLSLTLAEVYAEHAGPDGFLYVTYASQEVFG